MVGCLVLATAARAQMPPPGTPWRLAEIDGKPVAHLATLSFDAVRVAGRAACNSFRGSKTAGASELRIGGLAVTRMYCEGRMEEEAAFLRRLEDVRGWRIAGGELLLSDVAGKTALRFVWP
jgi:heat shock protein HslJ